MVKKRVRLIALLVAATTMLGACATTNDANLSPAEKKLREQASTFNQTIGEGAMVGCVAGALLGLLVSNNHKGQGAAMGCAAGAAVGGAAGYAVASQQESYANEEERLDAMITDVKTDNQRLAGLIETSRTVIASDKAEIANLDKKIAAGKISADQAKQEIAKVDSNIKYLQQTVANLKKRQEDYQVARDKAAETAKKQQTAAMDTEITTLKKQIAMLEGDLDGLMARRKVSRVG
ncbi:MAG: hypothetical protein JXQ84_08675 [Rhodospirillaceae bacterium]|nr:hypothetical protein [Rhodospirillaceae bacterium]